MHGLGLELGLGLGRALELHERSDTSETQFGQIFKEIILNS